MMTLGYFKKRRCLRALDRLMETLKETRCGDSIIMQMAISTRQQIVQIPHPWIARLQFDIDCVRCLWILLPCMFRSVVVWREHPSPEVLALRYPLEFNRTEAIMARYGASLTAKAESTTNEQK